MVGMWTNHADRGDIRHAMSIAHLVQPRATDGRFASTYRSAPEVTLGAPAGVAVPSLLSSLGPAARMMAVGPIRFTGEDAEAVLPGASAVGFRFGERDIVATGTWDDVDLADVLAEHAGLPVQAVRGQVEQAAADAREEIVKAGFRVAGPVSELTLSVDVHFHRDLGDRWDDVARVLREAPEVRFAGGDPRRPGSILLERIAEVSGLR